MQAVAVWLMALTALVSALACNDGGSTPSSAVQTPASTPDIRDTRQCDPSYPDVCIAPFPPDLDCDEIPFRRFVVHRTDPHGFDRDRDGIGCEWN